MVIFHGKLFVYHRVPTVSRDQRGHVPWGPRNFRLSRNSDGCFPDDFCRKGAQCWVKESRSSPDYDIIVNIIVNINSLLVTMNIHSKYQKTRLVWNIGTSTSPHSLHSLWRERLCLMCNFRSKSAQWNQESVVGPVFLPSKHTKSHGWWPIYRWFTYWTWWFSSSQTLSWPEVLPTNAWYLSVIYRRFTL